MTLAMLGLILIPLQYDFEPGTKILYDSEITFEGFIPILGGQEGTVVVKMGVDVEGLKPEEGAEVRVASEIVSFSVTFDDIPLPFDLSMVTDVFPRTTIKLQPNGKIVSSDAPDKQLPVRLPGLDVKRFPDITYVPVQFPKEGASIGDEWKYSKSFGGSDIHYKCKLIEEKDGIARISISIEQEYELLENAALEVVDAEIDAETRVKTVLTGKGHVLFDTRKGNALEVLMKNTALSDVTSLHDESKSKRELDTTFSLKLRKPEKPTSGLSGEGLISNVWERVKSSVSSAYVTTKNWLALLKLTFNQTLKQILPNGG